MNTVHKRPGGFPGKQRPVILIILILLFSAAALFAAPPGYVERGVPSGDSSWYLLIRHKGLIEGDPAQDRWMTRNAGLPARVVYPFGAQGIKDLTAVGVDPLNPSHIAVATSSHLFISENGGRSFREIPLSEPIKSSNYITAVSLKGKDIYIGTSFNGFFASSDGGKSWQKLSDQIPELYRGAGFYEEISGIAVDAEGARLALASSFDGLIFVKSLGRGTDKKGWERIVFPFQDEIRSLWFPRGSDGTTLELWGSEGVYRYTAGCWEKLEFPFDNTQVAIDPAREKRLEKASGRYGIYVNPSNAKGERLEALLDLVVANGMNSITVDMKDDVGWIAYDSTLDEVAAVGALHPRFKLDELIRAAHARGIYVVGRVVVFKDKRMYDYKNNAYAIWDSGREGPWGNRIATKNEETGETTYEQHEFWVDPFASEVWEYNLAVARELESRGVDEIQFDYIRFPSDGNMSRIFYRHRREGMSRIEALESFLGMVREEISVPLSTDLYGFNSWYRMGNWIGQNIELVSHYVDVICPMFYPSHFPRQFMNSTPYLERAEWIYREGSTRSAEIAQGRSLIRPYVQAFLLPFEYYMEEPEYSEYLVRQLRGTTESPASGFTLWNNTNRYYMITEPISSFTSAGAGTVLREDGSKGMLE